LPAVRLAREMIQAGQLGDIHHFRGACMQAWLLDRAAPMAWRMVARQISEGRYGKSMIAGSHHAHVNTTSRCIEAGQVGRSSWRWECPRRPGPIRERRDQRSSVVLEWLRLMANSHHPVSAG
jgi:hypothetical protein